MLVSAVVMYRVVDAKAASFNVQDYKKFVQLQATAALKLVVQAVKYDDLRKDSTHLMNKCQLELDDYARCIEARSCAACAATTA